MTLAYFFRLQIQFRIWDHCLGWIFHGQEPGIRRNWEWSGWFSLGFRSRRLPSGCWIMLKRGCLHQLQKIHRGMVSPSVSHMLVNLSFHHLRRTSRTCHLPVSRPVYPSSVELLPCRARRRLVPLFYFLAIIEILPTSRVIDHNISTSRNRRTVR